VAKVLRSIHSAVLYITLSRFRKAAVMLLRAPERVNYVQPRCIYSALPSLLNKSQHALQRHYLTLVKFVFSSPLIALPFAEMLGYVHNAVVDIAFLLFWQTTTALLKSLVRVEHVPLARSIHLDFRAAVVRKLCFVLLLLLRQYLESAISVHAVRSTFSPTLGSSRFSLEVNSNIWLSFPAYCTYVSGLLYCPAL
jgi:hypothetical protein